MQLTAAHSRHGPLKELPLKMTLTPASQLIGWLINRRPLHLWHINSKGFPKKSVWAQRHLTGGMQLVIESHLHKIMCKNIYKAHALIIKVSPWSYAKKIFERNIQRIYAKKILGLSWPYIRRASWKIKRFCSAGTAVKESGLSKHKMCACL